MPDPLLVVDRLCKHFPRSGAETLKAVDDISFTVNRGDIFGFLGPNGAGKSTTIRMALGLIHPTAGQVTIGGYDLVTHRLEALRKVGAFVEAPSFYGYLSGRKNLEIFAGLSGGAPRELIDETLKMVGLLGRENDPVKVYSHGMKARLCIAACLLPRPELMVLDEPTDGLDPHGIREIRELIKRLVRDENLTVFLSSHMLPEVENLCNRIAILEKGELILQGDLAELERQHRRTLIESSDIEGVRSVLLRKFNLEAVEFDQRSLRVGLGSVPAEKVLAALHAEGLPVRSFGLEPEWLDRLFLQITTTKESNLPAAVTRGGIT
jgi:ABC-2 type transport system ATP-binding protein